MSISYHKLLAIFQERGITSYTFRQNKVISQATWKNLKTGGNIDIKTLNNLCKYLNCQPGDLLEYIPDDHKTL